MTGKWHCVDTTDNAATICIDQEDAEDLAVARNRTYKTDENRAMQLVDSAEVESLTALLTRIHADLLMRAAEDENGKRVVNLSRSIWEQLKEALK